MMSRAAALLEPLKGVKLLSPFFRAPRVPATVGFYGGRIQLVSVDRLQDGRPYLKSFGEAPLQGHRKPTSLTQPNLTQPAAVAEDLDRLAQAVGVELDRCNLVLPDRAARVLQITLEDLPSGHAEQDEVLRWRLRKTTPFPIEEALLDWTQFPAPDGKGAAVLAVAIQRGILRQYEEVLEALDTRVASVTLETLALAELAPEPGAQEIWAVLHLSTSGFILLIFEGEVPLFYRCKTYAQPPADLAPAFRSELIPSMEYFRNRLYRTDLDRVHLCGPLSLEPAVTDVVQEVTGSALSYLDPMADLHVPPDLPLSDEAKIRFASCLGPSLRWWRS